MSTQNKWIIGIFAFVISIILILIALPFLINFNKFKPQIQNLVSEKINAKIDFTSAELTIFSGLGIELKNVTVTNNDEVFLGTELFKVKNLKFKTDFFALIQRRLVGKIEINNPEINFMRYTNNNNITSLIKKQTKKENDFYKKEKNIDENISTKDFKKSFIGVAIVKSFIVRNANIHAYNISGVNEREVFNIKNLNLNISNIGISKNTNVELSTNIDAKSEDFFAKGLVTLKLVINTELDGFSWKNSLFNGNLNFDNLDLNFRDAFVKKKSVPFQLAFSGIGGPFGISLDNFKLNLKSLNTNAKININGFEKLDSDIFVSVTSNNLSDLGDILPQHKKLLINATLDFKARMIGLLTQPESAITNIDLKSKLTNSDINLNFASNSIKPLIGSLKIKSQNLNLNQIIKPFISKNVVIEKKEVLKTPPNSNIPKTTFNEEFTITDNDKKYLNGANFNTNISISKMIYDDFELNDFALIAQVKNYNATLNKLSMNIFSGNLNSTANVQLDSSPITFTGNLNLVNAKIENIFKTIKLNTDKSPIEGLVDIKMDFNGKGITRPIISKTLNAKGTFGFQDGVLNTKSLTSLAGQQFNQFIASSSASALNLDTEALKRLTFREDNNTKRNLKNLKGNFEVKEGKLLIRNHINSDDGMLHLRADVGLDESLHGTADYIASNKVKEQLIAQSRYAKFFFNEKGEFELNIILSGTISDPQVRINTATLQARLASNASREFKTKINEELKKNAEIQKLKEDAKKLLQQNGINLKKLGF
ncbi:AsmA family protein [Spirobacillus cienkowskii]|uniref:AsmA family protein n=1 Tax=Spirobacillus cienkowskii TaxID=495820 RepID=UPI0030CFB9D0